MGGDGSLGCFIDDIIQEPLIASNIDNLVFVPLPYGTGNDLSRSLGWGNISGSWGKNLETLVSAIMNGQKDKFTVWDVSIYAKYIEGYSGRTRKPLE